MTKSKKLTSKKVQFKEQSLKESVPPVTDSSGSEETLLQTETPTQTPLNPAEFFRIKRDKDESPMTTIVRETIYSGIRFSSALLLGLHFDSNIYEHLSNEGEMIQKTNNVHHYITNKTFEHFDMTSNSNTVGSFTGASPVTASNIQAWLEFYGKIPKYVEVYYINKEKEYGVRATRDIAKGTMLGFYEGLCRPIGINPKNKYIFTIYGYEGEPAGAIDAENMKFGNWTRFVNDGAETRRNCSYVNFNYQILLFTTTDIKIGDEIVAGYGKEYWAQFGPMLD